MFPKMLRPEPITAYLGVNGSGKTLSAIAFALVDQRREDRPIVTNVDGLSVEHYYFDDVEALPDLLAEVGSCNIVMDEAGAMFPSRDGQGKTRAFRVACQQLRKYKSRLLWTAPTFARAEKVCREVTFTAVLCSPVIQRKVKGDPWPSTRLILQKGFNVARLDSSGQQMHTKAKTTGFGLVRTGRWERAYDTFATTAGIVSEVKAAS